MRFVETRRPGLLQTLVEKRAIDDGLRTEMHTTLKEFGAEFAQALKSAAA